MKNGASYTIYRYDDFTNVPSDSDYANSSYDATHKFTASAESYVYKDPKSIISSGTTYYRTVPTDSEFL